MAFSIRVDGLDQLMKQMEKAGENAEHVAAEGLYEGAGVMADAVSRAVQGIATEPFKYATGGKKRKASPEEKAIIQNAKAGVAKFRKNGISVQTSVGMQNAGYAQLGGKTVPIPLIVNSINSGTSFREKQPFLRKAFSQNKANAQNAIENGIKAHEKELEIGD